MRKFIVILAVLLLIWSCSPKKQSSGQLENIDTHGNFTVLVFDSTKCPYCIRLHKDLTTNQSLKNASKNFTIYFIHVNKNKKYILPSKGGKLKLDTEELANVFGFRGSTPFLVFTDKNLKPIVTIPGYLKPNTLKKVFEYVSSRAFQTMSLGQYLSTS